MKLSNKPTAYVLLKAYTNSDWDNCEFAILQLTEEWQKEQAKRIDLIKPLKGGYSFNAINFYDSSVEFYVTDEMCQPDIDAMLAGKQWTFIELEEGEQDSFNPPESRLDCHSLSIYANGTAFFTAYGKHTGEEFRTETFSLRELI